MQKSATPSCSIWPAAGAVGAVGNVAHSIIVAQSISARGHVVQAAVGAVGGLQGAATLQRPLPPVHSVHGGVSVHSPPAAPRRPILHTQSLPHPQASPHPQPQALRFDTKLSASVSHLLDTFRFDVPDSQRLAATRFLFAKVIPVN